MAETLEQGIQAFKAGNKAEARRIFLKLIETQPTNIKIWEWFYQVAHTDGERLKVLEMILQLDPNHHGAKQSYAELKRKITSFPPPQPQAVKPLSAAPPAKKNNNLLIGLGAAVIIGICCLCIAMILNFPTGSPFTGSQVRYVVSGSAQSAFITYFNETGGTEQINSNLPWTKDMSPELGAPLSIVAQNNGTGSITCEIWVNGEKRKTSTTTAQYGVVTCSDFLY